jgi:hypothetical protein
MLHIYLDSNSKCPLPHMRIADNNHNNRADTDSTNMMWIYIPKNDNCIMRMRILLMTMFTFSCSINSVHFSVREREIRGAERALFRNWAFASGRPI